MPILREGGGCQVEFRNDQPQVITTPSQATVDVVDATATQTLTGKTLTSPTITNPTISGTTPVDVTSSTLTLGSSHVGRTVTLNRATGIAVTLPASSGSGDVYKLYVKTTFTGAATVKVANTTDIVSGTAILATTGTTVAMFTATAADDTITMYGSDTTQGGIKGEVILLQDVASGIWSAQVVSPTTGTEATPFSATV